MESVERLREELDDVAEGTLRHHHRHAARRQGPSFSRSSTSSASSMPISALPTAIRARPSAPSSCCIRWSAAPAARQGRGYGFLQTHQPEHPVMRALISRRPRCVLRQPRSTCARRPAIRRSGGSRRLLVSGADKHATEGFARKLAAVAPLHERRARARPAEAPLAVVRGRYRFRLLVKSPRSFDLSAYLRDWLANAPKTHRHARSSKSISIRRVFSDVELLGPSARTLREEIKNVVLRRERCPNFA